jgi:transposase
VHTHLRQQGSCFECGGDLGRLGEDVSEMLEYTAASFKVIRHVRPKMSCAKCYMIVEAPPPSRPIEPGLAGPGLLTHVPVSKYANHLPLYRQSKIYALAGVDLDGSTRADWVGATSHLLTSICGRSAQARAGGLEECKSSTNLHTGFASPPLTCT